MWKFAAWIESIPARHEADRSANASIRRPSRSSAIVTVPTIRIDAGGGGAGSATSGLGRAADVQPSAEASTISTAARPLARPTGLPLHLSMAPPPEKQK